MKFTGNSALVSYEPRVTVDALSGTVVELHWRGSLTLLEAKQAEYLGLGRIDLQPHPGGSYGDLYVTLGGAATGWPADTALVDLWDLDGNDVEISIYACKKVRLAFPDATATQKANLRADIEAILRGDTAAADFLATWAGLDQLEVVTDLLEAAAEGYTSVPESQYVLRRTLILASNTSIKPSHTNVGNVYTTAALQAAEPIPTTLKFDLPDGYWRKRTPTTRATERGNFRTTIEWWWQETIRPLDIEAT